jgi:hypothetical protein
MEAKEERGSDECPQETAGQQTKSKRRVADHGEVFTRQREVEAMLNLVSQETGRIEARFLEPACGSGNFLSEILERKLRVVQKRYRKSQPAYEQYAVLSVSSIYGIDIMEDNISECRKRLFEIFDQEYTRLFNKAVKDECRAAIRYILRRNIIWGDALTLETVGANPAPIIFSEWSSVNRNMFKRRDFSFSGLLDHESIRELPLFSDLGTSVFLPTPEKEYPVVHFRQIADVDVA